MKNLKIIENAGRIFNKAVFKAKVYSPEILVVTGTVGIIISGVMACKATMKVDEILEQSKDDIEKIHKCAEDESLAEEYTEDDAKKDLTITYVKTGIKLAKLYAPSVALATLSLTGIITSNHILKKRNIALTAAYVTVDNSFKKYRKHVVERFGKEVDKELRYNIKAKQFEETVTDENGNEVKTEKTVNVVDSLEHSEYAKFFDASSRNWDKNPEYNLMFLRSEQQYANDLLRVRGYVFLNEIYERLDIQPTQAGQVVGWVYDPNDDNRDNYIDFGIYNTYRNGENNRDFVNGYEPVILLDFNVDGPILNNAFVNEGGLI